MDERKLTITKPGLSDQELRAMTALIKPYDILRVRLRLADEEVDAAAVHAELAEVIGKERSDKDLEARAAQLRKPVSVTHPFFGTLTLNRAVDRYETAFAWNGQSIRLHLRRKDCKNEDALFQSAQSLWKGQKKWERRIRDFAVQELLPKKNDLWLGEDEKEFTARRFKERMALALIMVEPDGSFEFTYQDGNLFWGHVILVGGTLTDGPTYAEIAG
jgi:hypothetical protein